MSITANDAFGWIPENTAEWRDVLGPLTTQAAQEMSMWRDLDAIVEVLNRVALSLSEHIVLMPNEGSLQLSFARRSRYFGCIDLIEDENFARVVRPSRLLLEIFKDRPVLSYLRLETNGDEPDTDEEIYFKRGPLVVTCKASPLNIVQGASAIICDNFDSGIFRERVDRIGRDSFQPMSPWTWPIPQRSQISR